MKKVVSVCTLLLSQFLLLYTSSAGSLDDFEKLYKSVDLSYGSIIEKEEKSKAVKSYDKDFKQLISLAGKVDKVALKSKIKEIRSCKLKNLVTSLRSGFKKVLKNNEMAVIDYQLCKDTYYAAYSKEEQKRKSVKQKIERNIKTLRHYNYPSLRRPFNDEVAALSYSVENLISEIKKITYDAYKVTWPLITMTQQDNLEFSYTNYQNDLYRTEVEYWYYQGGNFFKICGYRFFERDGLKAVVAVECDGKEFFIGSKAMRYTSPDDVKYSWNEIFDETPATSKSVFMNLTSKIKEMEQAYSKFIKLYPKISKRSNLNVHIEKIKKWAFNYNISDMPKGDVAFEFNRSRINLNKFLKIIKDEDLSIFAQNNDEVKETESTPEATFIEFERLFSDLSDKYMDVISQKKKSKVIKDHELRLNRLQKLAGIIQSTINASSNDALKDITLAQWTEYLRNHFIIAQKNKAAAIIDSRMSGNLSCMAYTEVEQKRKTVEFMIKEYIKLLQSVNYPAGMQPMTSKDSLVNTSTSLVELTEKVISDQEYYGTVASLTKGAGKVHGLTVGNFSKIGKGGGYANNYRIYASNSNGARIEAMHLYRQEAGKNAKREHLFVEGSVVASYMSDYGVKYESKEVVANECSLGRGFKEVIKQKIGRLESLIGDNREALVKLGIESDYSTAVSELKKSYYTYFKTGTLPPVMKFNIELMKEMLGELTKVDNKKTVEVH